MYVPNNSQGTVSTHIVCGGSFNDNFVTNVTNLLLNFNVKNFENWSALGNFIITSIMTPFLIPSGQQPQCLQHPT